MQIDSHQHFWHYDSSQHNWIDEKMMAIRRDFQPPDLLPVLKQNNIDGSVVVQVDQNLEETNGLLALAGQHDFIKGVVGWVDLLSDEVEEQLNVFKGNKMLKGFRHIVQSEPEGFMLSQDFKHGISKLKNYGFTYDILIYPHQLNESLQLVTDFPDQLFVIDHLAKPYIAKGDISNWSKMIEKFKERTNVYCKISGMVTEAIWDQWQYDQLSPYLDVIFNVFGTDRVMFGSDWPVCLLAAEYEEVLSVVNKYTSAFSKDEKAKIYGQNACIFYDLN